MLTTPERLRSLERLECLVRRLPAVGHALINQLDTQASEEELGGTLCCALANRLRITKPDAALKPGCDAPAYHSQAHHVTAWTSTGRTDITDLTLACDPDNRLAEKGWTTRKNTHGHTEWLPPPHLDHGQPRTNTFHHHEKLLRHNDEDNHDDP